MQDPNSQTSTAPPAKATAKAAVTGVDQPFTEAEAKGKEGVDQETRLFHGIDPETNERLAVTFEGLKAEFGDELGEKKYLAIAGIGGGSVFFNPNSEASTFRPSLGISALSLSLEELKDQYGESGAEAKFKVNQKYAAQIAEILAAKE